MQNIRRYKFLDLNYFCLHFRKNTPKFRLKILQIQGIKFFIDMINIKEIIIHIFIQNHNRKTGVTQNESLVHSLGQTLFDAE